MSAERRGGGGLYYVYALADAGVPRRVTAAGRRLSAIDIGGVWAVIEHVREPRAATEQRLREQHAIVTRLARRADALLPVRFGAVFTPAELDARVRSEHDRIRDAFDLVRGRVQMTLRFVSAAAPSPARTSSSGTAYLTSRSARQQAFRRMAARVRRAVSGLIADQRLEPGRGALHGTVYHLVGTSRVGAYRDAVDRIAPALAPTTIIVSGPWPVFAFVPELGSR